MFPDEFSLKAKDSTWGQSALPDIPPNGGVVLTGKAPHSKCGVRKHMGVRVPPPPLHRTINRLVQAPVDFGRRGLVRFVGSEVRAGLGAGFPGGTASAVELNAPAFYHVD